MYVRAYARVTGYAYFKDVARGRLSGGDASGFLKVVATAEGPTHHVIVGVQVIGACSPVAGSPPLVVFSSPFFAFLER